MKESPYVLPADFSQYLERSFESSLKVFHLNARSARNKVTDLECLFSQFSIKFNIIMFTETWYTEEEDVFRLPSYNHYCLNRVSNRGGGVCLLIEESIKTELLSTFCTMTKDYEVLSLVAENMLISVVYRPPDGNINTFLAYFEGLLGFGSDNNLKVIIGGDLNINMLLDTTPRTEFEILLTTYGYANIITLPTRITVHTETLIDLFITNIDHVCLKAGILTTHISDHLPIFLCVNDSLSHKKNAESFRHFQHITPYNLDMFRNDIENADWNNVFAATDPDVAYDTFLESFKRLYIKNFPYKKNEKIT